MVSPGILSIFLLGLFWKKATAKSAKWAAVLTIPVAFYFKIAHLPGIYSLASKLGIEKIFPKLPWMDQMGYSFLIITAIMVLISLFSKSSGTLKTINVSVEMFKTEKNFNFWSIVIMLIVASLYIVFW